MPSRLHLCLVQAETNQLTIVTVSTEDGAVKESHATISRSSITNDRGGLVVWCIISSQMFDPILRTYDMISWISSLILPTLIPVYMTHHSVWEKQQ